MTWDLYPDEKGGIRSIPTHRGVGYSLAAITGTVGAALAIDSIVFAMRAAVAPATTLIELRRMRLAFTTIVAFTTPITAGRRLGLYRAAGATPSGGTALTPVAVDSARTVTAGGLADARVATTGALTVAGITREATPFAWLTLTQVGAAGGYVERVYQLDGNIAPITLNPGELVVVSNPAQLDAAGTWQLGVDVDYTVNTLGLAR